MIQRPDAGPEIGAVVRRLIDEGAIRPLVGAVLPLDEGADALRLIERRRGLGKVVLTLR